MSQCHHRDQGLVIPLTNMMVVFFCSLLGNIWLANTKNCNNDYWCHPLRWLKLQFLWWVCWWTIFPREIFSPFALIRYCAWTAIRTKSPDFKYHSCKGNLLTLRDRNSYSLKPKKKTVADVIRTCLGPKAMLKMILDPMGGILWVTATLWRIIS